MANWSIDRTPKSAGIPSFSFLYDHYRHVIDCGLISIVVSLFRAELREAPIYTTSDYDGRIGVEMASVGSCEGRKKYREASGSIF